MRHLAPIAILGLLALPAHGQESSSTERTETLQHDRAAELIDPGPDQHMGWGTLEDVFVDVGGGAAVSLLSGNLVVHLAPVDRPSLPAGVRMALTYNHLDVEGARDLGPGWSWDLGRLTAAGPWGDRLLVDADGFRDQFWAGPPPTGEELDRVTDEVVGAWRRDTSAADRRRLGGVSALRELLASDPATLGAMRLRYLGPPPVDEEAPTLFRSGARGVRTMQVEDKAIVVTGVDGTRDTYGVDGLLDTVEPPSGAPWELQYEQNLMVSVSSRGIEQWSLERDSRGRIQSYRHPTGDGASIEYLGPLLRTAESGRGRWRFDYDERARLSGIDGPEGSVRVRYGPDGRVESLSGPLRTVALTTSTNSDALTVTARGLPGGDTAIRWEPGARRRTVTRTGAPLEAVTFASEAALPVEIVGAETTELAWSETGRLRSARRNGIEVTWERDASGAVTGIGAAGQTGAVTTEEGQVLTWSDPATRRSALERDHEGRLRALRRPDAPELTVRWHPEGGVSEVGVRDGAAIGLPRPGAPVGGVAWGGASAGVRRDAHGRITAWEGPTGLSVDLTLSSRIDTIRDERNALTLTYDGAGLLTGWSGPEGAVAIRRDVRGVPLGLSEGADVRWAVSHADGAPVRLDRDGEQLAVRFDDAGPISWERPGGARTEVQRDPAGRVERIADQTLGEIGITRDRLGLGVSARRGTGSWRIQRDRTGRPEAITDPLSARTDFTLDGAGRVASVAAPEGQGWRIRRDRAGRVTIVRSPEGDWLARRRADGRPRELKTPTGRHVLLRHDARGRPIELHLPGGVSTKATWGLMGPTQLGSIRWRLGSSGALVGWGDHDEAEVRWFLDLDDRGRARRLRLRKDPLLEVARAPGGRPSQLNDLELVWDRGLRRVGTEWEISRNQWGRARGWSDGVRSVTVDFDRLGDLRRFTDGDTEAVVSRDQSARIIGVALGEDDTITIERDALGRVTELARTGPEAMGARIQWSDVPPPESGLLAKAFGVQTDDPEPVPRAPAGSRVLNLRTPSSARLITTQLDKGSGDALSRVPATGGLPSPAGAGGLGADSVAAQPQHPLVAHPPRAIGDAARLLRLWTGGSARPADLAWMPMGIPESVRAWARVEDRFTAEGLVPSDVGRGDAGTLLAPLPAARSLVPSPPDVRRTGMAELLVLSGDLPPELLLLLDLGDALDAWRPELPGAAALGAIRRRLHSPSTPPWAGAEQIADVAPHGFGVLTQRGAQLEASRAWEPEPAIAGLPAGTPALLPGTGTPDEATAEAFGSTSAAGRGTALEALADDPLGVGEIALGQAHANSTLLALQALAGGQPSPLGGLLPDPAAAETWLLELPTGARVVVDGRGRLLSIDAAGRLNEAMAQATVALMARALLGGAVPARGEGSFSDPTDSAPFIPPFLPERGGVVEARWGLVPGVPELPIDARGRAAAPGWPRTK